MPFDLVITADSENRTADLRLLNEHGVQLAFRRTDFAAIPAGRRRALFDLRSFAEAYADSGREAQEAAVAEAGVCIAEEVLGEEIFRMLWLPTAQRTLRIRLPGAEEGGGENPLALALARVPWEIARPALKEKTLGERGLLVRVVHSPQESALKPLELAADEALRVLFVFAEARGSRPLGMRRERRLLEELFEREVYPEHRVAAHFLSHGVTRERLRGQLEEHGGYHIVHWSGHGHLNQLELAKAGGGQDSLSGGDLLNLFEEAGGFSPRLVFLSACHSGGIEQVENWGDFLAVAQGREPGPGERGNAGEGRVMEAANTREIDVSEKPGFTGTANALLQGGVASVAAMRYAVGDDYARELAAEFYRALLAHPQPKSAAAAFTLARKALLEGSREGAERFSACDHATPVLYGAEEPGLVIPRGRSPELEAHSPRLHHVAELTDAEHEHFAGRTWELAGLGAGFIGSASGRGVKPVAVITGPGGMGKTALAAEALSLWEERFEHVLLYQSKPQALGFEEMLRNIHLRLMEELGRYHDHVRSHPGDAVHLEPSGEFTGERRQDRLTQNLLRALRDEPVLLVLDNFEKNLVPAREDAGAGAALECQEPVWDRCLAALVQGLPGSRSRVLITCRTPLKALEGGGALVIALGPLPAGEAALFLREHPVLSRMALGEDAAERALAMRLLSASRFHPLLMDRLARLSGDPALRGQLLEALAALEARKDFTRLPRLFAVRPGEGRKQELLYLEDALVSSLDGLIREAGQQARLLLWMLALAGEPVPLNLLKGVWSGDSLRREQLREIKELLDILPSLQEELQEELQALPPEARAEAEALPPPPPGRSDPAPLLGRLAAAGLVTEDRKGPADNNPSLACHELVRERILAWMEARPREREGAAQIAVFLAYAERFEEAFKDFQYNDTAIAMDEGRRAVMYLVQAQAWERLGVFANQMVTGGQGLDFMEALIPYLRIASKAAPEGRWRRVCLGTFADALLKSGRPRDALPFYEEAAAQARAATAAGGEGMRWGWLDLETFTANWANALRDTGSLEAARERRLESAEAGRRGGRSVVYVVGSELEALRLDVLQGRAMEALPKIEECLSRVQEWRERHSAGEHMPETVDTSHLKQLFVNALDVAAEAGIALQDWPLALRRIEAALEIKEQLGHPAEDIAGTRMNRANVLKRLNRVGEALVEVEACLPLFENNPAGRAKVLSSLASLFANQGDAREAVRQQRRALVLYEQLPDPAERAKSHGNLGLYLEDCSGLSNPVEASRHRLTALIYQLAARLGQDLQTSFRNYVVEFLRARASGTAPAVPRVVELLADPAFHVLAEWLRLHQMSRDEVQAAVDSFLIRAHNLAANYPVPKTPPP